MRKIKVKAGIVDAYTEKDLAKDLSKQTSLSKQECQDLIVLIVDLLGKAIIKNDAVMIRNFAKFTKRVTKTKIHYHTRDTFEQVKAGKIDLKDVESKSKISKPYYRIGFSLCNSMKVRCRKVKKKDLPKK